MRGIAFLRNLIAALAIGAAFAAAARADEIEVSDVRLTAGEEGLTLAADFGFDLNARLAEAVTNGVPLYFLVEFELTRPRWYWFDEKAATKRLQLRLSYHPLSRHYRLSTGNPFFQNLNTIEEAERLISRVRGRRVIDRAGLSKGQRYEVAVRLRLDTSQLPKPFQLSAITNRELQVETPWRRFIVRAPQHVPAPVESREQKPEDR